MEGHFYKPNCKCPEDTKKCTCGATWSYIIDVGIDPKTGGRKQQKKGGFKTKRTAQLACGLVIQGVEQGTFIKESEITFKEFSTEWLISYENSGEVKESTVRTRKHEINRLLTYLAHIKLKDVTRKRYQDVLYDLDEHGLSKSSIIGTHAAGRMIFKKAIELKLIKSDPTQFATAPKKIKTIEELEEEEVVKYLEKKELSLFLKTAKEKGLKNDYPIFLLLSYTGMRVGEMCALKWKDIDFGEKSVNITKTYYNPTSNARKYKLTPPKTTASRRKISIDGVVLDELKKHKAHQNIVRMKNRATYHEKNFIFTREARYPGYPEIVKTVESRMLRLLKLAKLNESLTPHSLRHTHTSLLAEAGVSLPEIMERLGHKDDKTTKWVYTHTTKTMKKEASRKFSELMRSL